LILCAEVAGVHRNHSGSWAFIAPVEPSKG
jgi:hypothetical protein